MLVRQRTSPLPARITRTPLGRFAPGAIGGFSAVMIPVSLWFRASGLPLEFGAHAWPIAAWMGALGVGFAAAVRLMRPWLRPDAGLSGRRSVIAGAASACTMLTVVPGMIDASPLARVAVAASIGAAAAAATFFPWLLSRAERRALRELGD